MPETLKQTWDSYVDLVVPKEVTASQVEWLKRTYYSGAWALFSMMRDLLSEDETSDVNKMSKLQEEMLQYIQERMRKDRIESKFGVSADIDKGKMN